MLEVEQVCTYLWNLRNFSETSVVRGQKAHKEVMWYTNFVLLVIISVVGLVGNATVIWLTGFKMKTVKSNTWFLNLAVADFVFLLCLPPWLVSLFLEHWPLGTLMCTFHHFIFAMNMYVSIFILTAISIDRCISVALPLWHRKHVTRCLSLCICIALWTAAFLLSIPFLLQSKVATDRKGQQCLLDFYGEKVFNASNLFLNSDQCLADHENEIQSSAGEFQVSNINAGSFLEHNLTNGFFHQDNLTYNEHNRISTAISEQNQTSGFLQEHNQTSGFLQEHNQTSAFLQEHNHISGFFQEHNKTSGFFKGRNQTSGFFWEHNQTSGLFQENNRTSAFFPEQNPTSISFRQNFRTLAIFDEPNLTSVDFQENNLRSSSFHENNLTSTFLKDGNLTIDIFHEAEKTSDFALLNITEKTNGYNMQEVLPGPINIEPHGSGDEIYLVTHDVLRFYIPAMPELRSPFIEAPDTKEECYAEDWQKYAQPCVNRAELEKWHRMISSMESILIPLQVISVFIPLIIIILCNVTIVVIVSQSQSGKTGKYTRLYLVILIMVAVYFLSWTPTTIVQILFMVAAREMNLPLMYRLVSILPLISCIASIHSCLNPILYVLTGQNVRTQLKKSISGMWQSVSRSTQAPLHPNLPN
ncbi:C3a anaphylatoxin chemotactic receptor-like isoform X2 [Ambystoma mexicanum]